MLAATNRDPGEAIQEGRLREDLYYRLNVFTITLPTLRERPEDIRLLAHHFTQQYAARASCPIPAIDQGAMQQLLSHRWPGNVRELKSAIDRSSLVSDGATILAEHLPPEILAAQPSTSAVAAAEGAGSTVSLPVGTSMADVEREMIRSTIAHTSGNKTRAAKILGISLKTMHNKFKKYNL